MSRGVGRDPASGQLGNQAADCRVPGPESRVWSALSCGVRIQLGNRQRTDSPVGQNRAGDAADGGVHTLAAQDQSHLQLDSMTGRPFPRANGSGRVSQAVSPRAKGSGHVLRVARPWAKGLVHVLRSIRPRESGGWGTVRKRSPAGKCVLPRVEGLRPRAKALNRVFLIESRRFLEQKEPHGATASRAFNPVASDPGKCGRNPDSRQVLELPFGIGGRSHLDEPACGPKN